MAETGPTKEQLDKVKEYEQKNYSRVTLTNKYWRSMMTGLLNNGVDCDTDYMKLMNSITSDDIKDVCRQIVEAGNRIHVTMK